MATDQSVDNILSKIEALLSRTVERGATEAEALAAATKAAKLLDQHGLTLTDLQVSEQKGASESFRMHATRPSAVCKMATTIADFTDTRVWMLKAHDGRYLVFFGFPEDAKVASMLASIINRAMKSEWRSYREFNPGAVREAFYIGMTHRLQSRLKEIKEARHQVSASGTALVPVKTAQVDAWMEELDLNLRDARARKPKMEDGSYWAGHEAGGRVRLNDELEG